MDAMRLIAVRCKSPTYEGKECIHGHGTRRYTRNGECVECRNEYAKKKRQARGLKKRGRPRKNPDCVIKHERRWPKYPSPVCDFDRWVLRIKKAHKERRFLAYKYFLSLRKTHCPLLNIELNYGLFEGRTVPDSYATLDKIDPSKGYVIGNLQILSHRANTLKNNATIEELTLLLENWKKL
jgi:hypothetical protein